MFGTLKTNQNNMILHSIPHLSELIKTKQIFTKDVFNFIYLMF